MRMRLVFGILALVWIVLLTRIYYLSIKSNEYYEEIAERNVVKTELIAPVRGLVLDVNGKPLAVNRLGFSISIKPHLRKSEKLDEEVEFITSVFSDLNATKLIKEYKKSDSPYNQDFVEIVEFVDYDKMLPHFAKFSLRENILIKPASKRYYPYDDLASHVIGYVGRSNLNDITNDELTKLTNYTGRSGIEYYYNKILQGTEGVRKVKVTALNQEVQEISYTPPSSRNIKLTIDLDLQRYITEIFGNDAGSAIVMDLKDGAILAAGSFPEYNLNPFVTGFSQKKWEEMINNLDRPFINKIVNANFPPGSVVKMGVALAFLDTGKMDRNSGFSCSGSFELGNRNFRCWKSWGHGFVDMVAAIRESCDDYFYKGSLKVGIDAIVPVLTRLGLGRKTGIDLPDEYIGTVPSREWKMKKYKQPWYHGETLITSIGQGQFLVTPMQIAKFTASFATGKEITPHFLHSIDDNKSIWKVSDQIFTPFEKRELPYIQKAMYEVANHPKGTAYKVLKNSIITLAAKTGTAQVVSIPQNIKVRMREEDMKYYERSHAWITTYGPYEEPRYVVTVLVEHGGHGGGAGGPIVMKIYDKLVEMGYIDKKFAKRKLE